MIGTGGLLVFVAVVLLVCGALVWWTLHGPPPPR